VLKAACERAVLKVAREEQCDVVDSAVIASSSKPGNVVTIVNCRNGRQIRVQD